MAGAPPPTPISEGILRTRDLVELYYGRRFVTVNKQSLATPSINGVVQILGYDLRRIKWEVWVSNTTATGQDCFFGTRADIQAGNNIEIFCPAQRNIYLTRNFLTDGETVCDELFISADLTQIDATFRAVILSPLPVDEIP